jgi:hypothetical protein
MKRGGSFMEQLLTGGLLSTDKARDMARKLPAPVTSMLGGVGLPKLLNQMGSRAQAPAAAAAASPSQEEIDKQIDAALRQRAAQGQQMASKGAGPAQVGTQVGQVRQAFKGGGGLRQMVQLPSNRVRFGKTAYQDGSYVGEALEEKIVQPVEEFFTQPFDMLDARARAEFMRKEADIFDERYGSPFNLDIYTDYFKPGEASAFLKEADQRKEDFEASLDKPKQKEEEAKTEPTKKLKDSPKPTKPKGEDLYRSPEEAAYASLMDSDAGQQAAKRYFAGENVGLANISEALKAYKGFKDTEMAQRRLIDKAQREKAKATAAAMRARLEDQKIMSEIVKNLDARDVATLNAIGKQIDTLTLTVGPDAPEIANLMARQNALIAKGQSNLARAAELGSVQYGASKPVKERLAKENNLALAQRLAALEAAQKEG